MAVQIPLWLLGKHYSSIVITAQVPNTAGVLSNSTVTAGSVTVTRVKSSLAFNINPIKEEINDDASVWANNVVLADDASMTIGIKAVNDGTDPDKFYGAIAAHDYFKAVFTYGTGASARTVTFYGSRGEFSHNASGRGNTDISLTLDLIDTGTGADAPITRA